MRKTILTFRFILGFFLAMSLFACSSPTVKQYAQETPMLDLSEYFNGTIDAYGIFTDRNGSVKKRFTVLLVAKWSTVDGKKTGILDESFEYSDGTKQKRIWTLVETAPGVYSGTADDVVGSAIGESAGNALNWTYTLALPVDDSIYHVQFNDWMYLVTPKVMINKAKMSKFGIDLGEVTLSFYKR
jgi:Protein of unknown function (DUF3833)